MARSGMAWDMAITTDSMIWCPTFTGEAPTVAGYWAWTTEAGGAVMVMGRRLPSLWYSPRAGSRNMKRAERALLKVELKTAFTKPLRCASLRAKSTVSVSPDTVTSQRTHTG